MAITKEKGDIGMAMIMADVLKKGYKVAIPVGEDWKYDLIVLKKNKLERIQCKYTTSNGDVIDVICRSCNNHLNYKYKIDDIDWLAVYDITTNLCYYIDSNYLGEGRCEIRLRINEPENKQIKKILWAKDFLNF